MINQFQMGSMLKYRYHKEYYQLIHLIGLLILLHFWTPI